jgi:diaminohydroxyphosphoribosylaminopyrimidine deaminase/5-amino-6-(5-phosphoribosylamino)uracil reductase
MNEIEMQDRFYMRRALELAEQGKGKTSPNPMVGCVIVKDGRVIGEGYHKKAGAPHAEVNAVRAARKSIEGATVYVNLEPCAHYGRTPPCVDLLLKERPARVVIAMRDPNPLVSGKSVRRLRAAGIEVRTGVFGREARQLNEVFVTNMEKKRPYVVAKWAQTLDGRIADKHGESRWITSSEARRRARELRGIYDAVCVGAGTAVCDDPRLEVPSKKMIKVVIDPNGRTPSTARLFENARKVMVVTAVETQHGYPSVTELVPCSCKDGRLDLNEVLGELFERGVMSLFVEGGARTLGAFFDARLVDKVYVFTAPKVMVNKDALSPVRGESYERFAQCIELKSFRHRLVGESYMTEGYPVYTGETI